LAATKKRIKEKRKKVLKALIHSEPGIFNRAVSAIVPAVEIRNPY
jgi:hypothetical protein